MSGERKARAGIITGMASLDVTWQTPPELLACVRAYFGGRIPFDAATSESNPCGADAFCTAKRSGLEASWPSSAWVNPPYGKALRVWLAKMSAEAARGVQVLALLPCARWEQHYFQAALASASCACFIRKRVAFIRPETGDRVGGNPYANMILGWNVDLERFTASFREAGIVVELRARSAAPEDGLRQPRPTARSGSGVGARGSKTIHVPRPGNAPEAPDPNA